LTENEVKEIKERYKTGDIRQYDLSREYNVSIGQISSIVNERNWQL